MILFIALSIFLLEIYILNFPPFSHCLQPASRSTSQSVRKFNNERNHILPSDNLQSRQTQKLYVHVKLFSCLGKERDATFLSAIALLNVYFTLNFLVDHLASKGYSIKGLMIVINVVHWTFALFIWVGCNKPTHHCLRVEIIIQSHVFTVLEVQMSFIG